MCCRMTRIARAACVLPVLLGLLARAVPAQIANPSFETGDLAGWTAQDLTEPLLMLHAWPAGTIGYFGTQSSPTDGDFSVVTGFDGNGPGTISLCQVVGVPAAQPVLRLDFLAQWDLLNYVGGTILDRTFSVVVEAPDGPEVLQAFELVRARGKTVYVGTERVTAAVPLQAFAGQDVRLRLAWDVPQDFSGPAFFDLDHLRFAGKKVPATEAASLKLKLDFAHDDHDALQLVLALPLGVGFVPDGTLVEVAVGDLQLAFVLDAQGGDTQGGSTLKLVPLKSAPGYHRLKLAGSGLDCLAGLEPYGLVNTDTPKAGAVACLPIHVEVAGAGGAERELFMVYKAKQGKSGSAKGKVASEVLAGKLSLRLDLAQDDADELALKTVARTGPGFEPGGQVLGIEIGGVSRSFTLDSKGQGSDGHDWIAIARDPQDCGRQKVSLALRDGSFDAVLSDLLEVDVDTPKGGVEVAVPVRVSLDGRGTLVSVPVTYKAKQGQVGKAKG